MPDWLVDAVFNHWGMLLIASVPFLSVGVFALVAGWLARKNWDRAYVEYWGSLVAEYKDKLNDASPIEVAARIDQLKQEVAHLQRNVWRSVSARQREKFQHAALAIEDKSRIYFNIYCETIETEAEAFGRELMELFRNNGFTVGFSHVQGMPLVTASASLIVQDRNQMPVGAKELSSLLRESEIDLEIVSSPRESTYSLLIGRRPAI